MMPVLRLLDCMMLTVLCGVGCDAREEESVLKPRNSGTRITVDPFCVRNIRGISELKRETYFCLCDGGTDFDKRCKSKERYDDMIRNNGITFGRALGVVNGLDRWYQAIQEDPARPGFVDTAYLKKKLAVRMHAPGEEFKQDMKGRLDVVAHEKPNAFPEFMGVYLSKDSAREKEPCRLPENIEAAARLTASTLRYGYTDFNRPAYFEPINEPHWSYWRDDHLAEWHLATMAAVHRETPGVLVGGPCLSVAYYYRKQYEAFKGLQAFIDHTRCKLDFYSFHIYDYLREKNGDFGGRITSGLPLESVLDLVQNHAVTRYGKEIAVVVSEHGGYGANDLVETLARKNFQDTGFDREMKKRSIDDFNMVSSVIANTLVFMDHPQTIRKAVPFILLEAMNWDPEYYAVLYVPRNYTDKNDWVATRKICFYQIMRGVHGHRVTGFCPDPDIQMRAFVDGGTLWVILNNLSNVAKPLSLRMPPAKHLQIRRFGRNPDFTPYLTEQPLTACDDMALQARETVVVRAEYDRELAPRHAVDEIPCYGDRIAVPVEDEARFTVGIPQGSPLDYAILRIGVSRPADAGWDVAVTLNGKNLTVPLEQCAERLTETGNEYASCKIIPLDPTAIKEVNTIGVSFPDGRPGSVGAVVIRAGFAVPLRHPD